MRMNEIVTVIASVCVTPIFTNCGDIHFWWGGGLGGWGSEV